MEYGGDFDASVAAEWGGFERRLGEHVGRMRAGQVLGLAAGPAQGDLSRCHVQLRAGGTGWIAMGLSDHPIPPPVAVERLEDPRFDVWWTERDAPGVEVAWIAKSHDRSADLAVVATSVLRAGALSPEFVTVTEQGTAGTQGPGAGGWFRAAPGTPPTEPGARMRAATTPREGDGLTTSVVKAVARDLGAKPPVDEHGDLVLDRWAVPVFVRVGGPRATLEKRERVTVFAHLPIHLGAADARTAQAVAEIDAELGGMHLRVEGATCVVSVDVPVEPFDAGFLIEAIRRVGASTPTLHDRLVEHLAVRGADGPTPPALMCLIELAADGGEPLRPTEVAQVCGYDRDRILGFLARCTDAARESAAAAAASRARGEDAGEHEAETAAWHEMRAVLRGALRVVVLSEPRARHTA